FRSRATANPVQVLTVDNLLENILSDLKRLRLAYERRGLLGARDSASATGGTAPSPLARELLLADGLLRNVIGKRAVNSSVPHVTVFGGTQVGKSTVVNVLAGQAL